MIHRRCKVALLLALAAVAALPAECVTLPFRMGAMMPGWSMLRGMGAWMGGMTGCRAFVTAANFGSFRSQTASNIRVLA